MGDNTKIEWAHHTFNPWIGCTKVSPACAHCYAENYALRYGRAEWGPGKARVRTSAHYWKQPLKWDREAQMLGTRPRVFCASLADWLDDDGVPIEWLCDLLMLIRATPHLDWLLLSKRPENFKLRMMMANGWLAASGDVENYETCPKMQMAFWIGEWMAGSKAPENVWMGCTVESQVLANSRVPLLLSIPARVRFLSCEPLLGPVMLRSLRDPDDALAWTDALSAYRQCDGMNVPALGERIHWVIAGGESGPHARPSHPEWFRSLRTQCEATGTAFHFKQWGEFVPLSSFENGNGPETVIDALGREITGNLAAMDHTCARMFRVGKKTAGRLLDEREWNEFPALGGGRDL